MLRCFQARHGRGDCALAAGLFRDLETRVVSSCGSLAGKGEKTQLPDRDAHCQGDLFDIIEARQTITVQSRRVASSVIEPARDAFAEIDDLLLFLLPPGLRARLSLALVSLFRLLTLAPRLLQTALAHLFDE